MAKKKRLYECMRCNQEFDEPEVDAIGMQVCPNCKYSGILPVETSTSEKAPDIPKKDKKQKKKTTRDKTRQLKLEL